MKRFCKWTTSACPLMQAFINGVIPLLSLLFKTMILLNVWRAKRAMGGRRKPRSSCRRQRIAIVVIMIWYVSPNGEKIGLVPPPLHTGLPSIWFTPPGLLSLKKTHNVSGDARRRKGSSLWSISSANLSYCMHLTTPKIGKVASIFLKRELKLFAILQFYIFFGLSLLLLTLFLFEIWIDMILFFFVFEIML